ncbi:unnamed protein product [Cyprideis torosa]|uniref:Transcription initiation factor TFIID 150 kDa subunit n=1 Tax=Cyprideis torosa TaxID=163714 RepID=A0A7R8WF84_9CRUS|nr:unnamed protein product [Cyprideis torosa]CAG0896679.1 unnamed protein product [Cyprideis torosa]
MSMPEGCPGGTAKDEMSPFKHSPEIEGNHAKMDITCHSRARRNKKKKIPLSTGEEVDMDLSQMDADCPVLWIRIDPDMNQFRKVEMEQPDFMWQFQLRYERDVSAQREALVQLEKFPSPQTRQALQDVIENEQCYIHVRTAAADTLKKVTNDIVAKSIGPAHLDVLIAIFRQHFGSKSCPQIVQRNDFSNLQLYCLQKVRLKAQLYWLQKVRLKAQLYWLQKVRLKAQLYWLQKVRLKAQLYCLQKALPVAVAGLRSPGGTCPPEVMSFLFDLFKYNDNRKNMFSDCYYRAALIDALGESITPSLNPVMAVTGALIDALGESITPSLNPVMAVTGALIDALGESITPSLNPVMAVTGFEAPISVSPGTRAILDEIHRALNKEKLAPTYKFMVTVSCLKVIRKLQSNGHIPPNPYFFRSYAHSGQFVDVRIAAIDALVDYLRLSGNPEDMDFLLSFVVEDPNLYVRHYVARRLMENPPFTPLTHSQSPLNTPELAEKLWSLIDSELSTQNRLRCDVVDVYFSLYHVFAFPP